MEIDLPVFDVPHGRYGREWAEPDGILDGAEEFGCCRGYCYGESCGTVEDLACFVEDLFVDHQKVHGLIRCANDGRPFAALERDVLRG